METFDILSIGGIRTSKVSDVLNIGNLTITKSLPYQKENINLNFDINLFKVIKPTISLYDVTISRLPFKVIQDVSIDGIGITGIIEGIVKEKGIPVSRRVFCYHRKSGNLISSTLSDKNGYYSFDNLIKDVLYFVVSLDEFYDGTQYPGVIQDLIPAKGKI